MAADCWQRAVAYNLSMPTGCACSIRRSKEAGVLVGMGVVFCEGKIGLSCSPGLLLPLKFDIGLIGLL